MRKSTKIVTAAAVAGLAFAGVSAFTASNTQPLTSKAGYGTTTVSGATVNSLEYNLSTTGANVESVDLVLSGNTTGSTVQIAYNLLDSVSCTAGTVTADPVTTPYNCVGTIATSALTATHVIVN